MNSIHHDKAGTAYISGCLLICRPHSLCRLCIWVGLETQIFELGSSAEEVPDCQGHGDKSTNVLACLGIKMKDVPQSRSLGKQMT